MHELNDWKCARICSNRFSQSSRGLSTHSFLGGCGLVCHARAVLRSFVGCDCFGCFLLAFNCVQGRLLRCLSACRLLVSF